MFSKKTNKLNDSDSILNKVLKNTFGKIFYNRETVLGVDISPHYIRICQMKNSYGKWSISNLSSTCIEQGFWNYDIESNIEIYSDCLKKLIKENKVKAKNVSYSVPSSDSIVRVLKFADMEEKDFHEAAKLGSIWESEIELDEGINNYNVYYKILRHNDSYKIQVSPDDNPESEEIDEQIVPATIEVLFVGTKKHNTEIFEEIIRNAGLNPLISIPKSISLKHTIDIEKDNLDHLREPYAFIEFGPDSNCIFIIDGDYSGIYEIEISAEDINNLIYHPNDKEKIEIFVKNYSEQCLEILKNHQSFYETEAIVNIFVTSDAPLHVDDPNVEPTMKLFLREIRKYFKGRSIDEFDFCSNIEVPKKFNKKVNAEGNIAPWASAIGSASRKVDIFDYATVPNNKAIDQTNLSKSVNLYKKNYRVNIFATLISLLILIITAFLLFISYIKISHDEKSIESELQSLQNIEKNYSSKKSEVQKFLLVMNKVNSLDDIRSSLPSNQTNIINSLKHISKTYPDGIKLKEIDYSSPNKIKISGVSNNDQNILNFVEKLNADNQIMSVSLNSMKTEFKENDNKFSNNPSYKTFVKDFVIEGLIKEKDDYKSIMKEGL